MTTIRGKVARKYKRVELRLYAYESRRDPEVRAWIAEARTSHANAEDVPSVDEMFRAIVGDRSSAH